MHETFQPTAVDGETNDSACCDNSPDGCSPTMNRRQLLQIGSAAFAATFGDALPIMAGPFESENEYLRVIPHDKKLDPAWVKSLFEREGKIAR